jgi:anti-anti-sigma regulatory factor
VTSTFGSQSHDPAALVAFPESAIEDSVSALRSRSERALAAGSRAFVIELQASPRIDTQTLSELCIALRAISRHGAKLAVVGADQRISWALTLCEIDGLELHPTIRSAFARSRTNQRKLKLPRPGDVPVPRQAPLGRSTPRS